MADLLGRLGLRLRAAHARPRRGLITTPAPDAPEDGSGAGASRALADSAGWAAAARGGAGGRTVSVDEHLARCLSLVAPLPPVELDLLAALGCVLAADVVAAAPLPAFDNSAMDGYAVRVADLAGADEDHPVTLPVVADLPAGSAERPQLGPGQAVRIMTGAPVPPGAEAVVPVEATDAGTERVRITAAVRPGQHVRPAGDDVRDGDLLVAAGTRLLARHLGLLAASGHGRVLVHPRPRVAVVATGDELVEPGSPVGFGQVTDSNSTALVAAAHEAGATAHRVRAVGDDPRGEGGLLAVLERLAGEADLVVTTGGVSAGAFDVVKDALTRLGTVRFDRVAMQPGKPQGAGTVAGGVPILTLPGNPVSAYVSFEVFVRPVLQRLRGEREVQRPRLDAVVTREWRSTAGKRQFVRGVLARSADGGWTVAPAGGHGSHLVADLATADCLVDVPADATLCAVGDVVVCIPLDGAPAPSATSPTTAPPTAGAPTAGPATPDGGPTP